VALPWGQPLTVADLETIPDDGHRYEIVDGTMLVTPAPARLHQRCVVRLAALLLAASGDEHEVLAAPFDWIVNDVTKFQPDILVARRDDVGEQHLDRTPLLVVEVLSPSTRLTDLTLKRRAYERAGVPAYWVVDPDVPELTVLRMSEGEYVEAATITGAQEIGKASCRERV
jgi:Uma2 family endonuclease